MSGMRGRHALKRVRRYDSVRLGALQTRAERIHHEYAIVLHEAHAADLDLRLRPDPRPIQG